MWADAQLNLGWEAARPPTGLGELIYSPPLFDFSTGTISRRRVMPGAGRRVPAKRRREDYVRQHYVRRDFSLHLGLQTEANAIRDIAEHNKY